MQRRSRPRWLCFSLRTLLVLVTAMCLYLGWATHWIRQRNEFVARPGVLTMDVGWLELSKKQPPRAPLAIRILGEGTFASIAVPPDVEQAPDLVALGQMLFPETVVELDKPALCGGFQ